jgi:hypothetical protein
LEVLQHAVADHKAGLAEGDVDALVRQLLEHKHVLQQQQREAGMELLLHFLLSSRCGAAAVPVCMMCVASGVGAGCSRALAFTGPAAGCHTHIGPAARREDKVKRLQQLQEELQCLEGDIQRVEAAGAATPTGVAAAPSTSHHTRPSTPGAGPAAQAESRSAAAMTDAPTNAAQGGELVADDGSSDGGVVQQASSAAGTEARAGRAPTLDAAAHQQLVQQQQAQHIADFAGAAFASLAAQALGAGGGAAVQPPEPSPPPGHPSALGTLAPGAAQPQAHRAAQQHLHPRQPQHHLAAHPAYASLLSPGATTSSGGGSSNGHRDVLSLLRNKKRRIASQFEDLQQCYLQLRAGRLRSPGGNGADSGGGGADDSGGRSGGGTEGAIVDEGLQEFSRLLSVITRCNKLKVWGGAAVREGGLCLCAGSRAMGLQAINPHRRPPPPPALCPAGGRDSAAGPAPVHLHRVGPGV